MLDDICGLVDLFILKKWITLNCYFIVSHLSVNIFHLTRSIVFFFLRLARKQKEICKPVGPMLHGRVEDFLNKQIQSLQCTCRILEDKGMIK